MQVSEAKRYRRTVLLIEGEGVVTLVTRRVPTARDNGLCGGSGVRIRRRFAAEGSCQDMASAVSPIFTLTKGFSPCGGESNSY